MARHGSTRLATVLYEMLSGKLPFVAKNSQALIARRFVEVAPRLSRTVADLPTHIDDAIALALSAELSFAWRRRMRSRVGV